MTPPLTWTDARTIARGALSRSYCDAEERHALARLIARVRTRPPECAVWAGSCMDCPHLCPLGRKDP